MSSNSNNSNSRFNILRLSSEESKKKKRNNKHPFLMRAPLLRTQSDVPLSRVTGAFNKNNTNNKVAKPPPPTQSPALPLPKPTKSKHSPPVTSLFGTSNSAALSLSLPPPQPQQPQQQQKQQQQQQQQQQKQQHQRQKVIAIEQDDDDDENNTSIATAKMSICFNSNKNNKNHGRPPLPPRPIKYQRSWDGSVVSLEEEEDHEEKEPLYSGQSNNSGSKEFRIGSGGGSGNKQKAPTKEQRDRKNNDASSSPPKSHKGKKQNKKQSSSPQQHPSKQRQQKVDPQRDPTNTATTAPNPSQRSFCSDHEMIQAKLLVQSSSSSRRGMMKTPRAAAGSPTTGSAQGAAARQRPTLLSHPQHRTASASSVVHGSGTKRNNHNGNSGMKNTIMMPSPKKSPPRLQTRRSTIPGPRPEKPSPQAAMIEVSPGLFAPLRSAGETWFAVQNDFFDYVDCVACGLQVNYILDADFVLCPRCRFISPVQGYEAFKTMQRSSSPSRLDFGNYNESSSNSESGGVGLGFTNEELVRWQKDLLQSDMDNLGRAPSVVSTSTSSSHDNGGSPPSGRGSPKRDEDYL